MYACMNLPIYIYMYTYIYICIFIINMYAHNYIYMYIYIYYKFRACISTQYMCINHIHAMSHVAGENSQLRTSH